MSLDDRLSFGDSTLGDLPPEPEPESGGRKPNRVFIFIAIAMGGLIILGVLALVGALAFVVPRQKAQQAAAVTQTIEAATMDAAAWTPTFTPSPTAQLPTWTPLPATWTPVPTATSTRVVKTDATPTSTVTPTRAAVADWGAGSPSTPTTPSAGLGGFGTAAIAVGLSGLIFAVRKLRS